MDRGLGRRGGEKRPPPPAHAVGLTCPSQVGEGDVKVGTVRGMLTRVRTGAGHVSVKSIEVRYPYSLTYLLYTA